MTGAIRDRLAAVIAPLKLAVCVGIFFILAVLAVGTASLLSRSEQETWKTKAATLARSAQAIEIAFNRQMLQVDGALASLPMLLDAMGATPADRVAVGRLLQSLNFQTLVFRDLLLVDEAGSILASARPRGARRSLPFGLAQLRTEGAALVGPVRNELTGDWSIHLVRAVPKWSGVRAVAEVPLPALMEVLAQTGLEPGVKIALERADRRLVASLPHDEVAIGQLHGHHRGHGAVQGAASRMLDEHGEPSLMVERATLHGDLRVVLGIDQAHILAGWRKDREKAIAAAALAAMLVSAFGAALLLALRQRDRADAERARAAKVVANAIEAMSDGFVMWDEQDRMVTCNRRYRELYALSADLIVAGARFEDIVRRGALRGQYPQAGADIEGFVRATVAWHRQASGSIERLLPDGRWLLITERRMPGGGVVGIRTDITALKHALAELAEANARATEAAAEARRQNAALIESESRIRFLAHHDDLTGLQNRLLFRDRITRTLAEAASGAGQAALLFLDLDRFKDVNDTLGHAIGDLLLRAVAARLIDCVGDADRVARLSGDEFAIISLGAAQPAEAEALGAAIIAALGRPHLIEGHTISVGASVGIAVADAAPDADAMLKQADLALYRAKSQRRGSACVFAAEMGEHLRARLAIEADLGRALSEGQFELVYQPIYALANGALSGFEALLRWNHPERGAISPAEFIPIAEETLQIAEIGDWILRQACRDIVRCPGALKVAVNLSPVQLAFGDVVSTVRAALAETGLDPGRLELEITETALFANDQRNMDTLRRLRQLGVRIVLDDFGTGYSSLSHLRLCPLDKIKIDRSFVRDMAERSDSAAIVSAIAALAAQLGMTTTAEGIETEEQWEAARRAGCTQGQGFLLGRPESILRAIGTVAAGGRARPIELSAAESA